MNFYDCAFYYEIIIILRGRALIIIIITLIIIIITFNINDNYIISTGHPFWVGYHRLYLVEMVVAIPMTKQSPNLFSACWRPGCVVWTRSEWRRDLNCRFYIWTQKINVGSKLIWPKDCLEKLERSLSRTKVYGKINSYLLIPTWLISPITVCALGGTLL